ncbi:MAG: hypothetical protein H6546_03325 [Chitinophagales bacterium]|nr:hypothetical protein [Chitinophagales bacterium]
MKRYRVYYLIVLLAISYGRAQVFGFEEDRNLAMDTVEFNIDMKFYVHGISTDTLFDYDRYIMVLGVPDQEIRGGLEIRAEFGCDDFILDYSGNSIWAGHCYLSDVILNERGISINGLEVGDSRQMVENLFKIDTENSSVVLIRWDALLIIEFGDDDHIRRMCFSQRIT